MDSALIDVRTGLARWRVAAWMAWRDAVLPYRRSILGPFWITIQIAFVVTLLGLVFRGLLGGGDASYVAHVGLGFIFYAFLSSSMVDGAAAFSRDAGLIQSLPMARFLSVLRVSFKSLIVLAFHAPVAVGVLIYYAYNAETNLYPFDAIIGFVMVVLSMAGVSLCLGCLSALIKDMSFAIQSVMRVMFFATPVLWQVDSATGVRALLAVYNPFAHFLALIRSPLLGEGVPMLSYYVVAGLGVLSWGLGLSLFAYVRGRIAVLV